MKFRNPFVGKGDKQRFDYQSDLFDQRSIHDNNSGRGGTSAPNRLKKKENLLDRLSSHMDPRYDFRDHQQDPSEYGNHAQRDEDERQAEYQRREEAQRRAEEQRQIRLAEEARLANEAADRDLLNARRHNASKDKVRYVRQLIMQKYRTDIYVWNERDCQPRMRLDLEVFTNQADATLEEMATIVRGWDEDLFKPLEWTLAQEIKESVLMIAERQVRWQTCPPWAQERLERSFDDLEYEDVA